jgi:hypothetical protein
VFGPVVVFVAGVVLALCLDLAMDYRDWRRPFLLLAEVSLFWSPMVFAGAVARFFLLFAGLLALARLLVSARDLFFSCE